MAPSEWTRRGGKGLVQEREKHVERCCGTLAGMSRISGSDDDEWGDARWGDAVICGSTRRKGGCM